MSARCRSTHRNATPRSARRWHLPFPIHSDPGGDRLLKQLDLWNPADRGGIAWPAMLIFDAEGREVRRYRSRDFADRPPNDDDVLSDLRALRLPAISVPTWTPDVEPVDDPGASADRDVRSLLPGHSVRGPRFVGTFAGPRRSAGSDPDERHGNELPRCVVNAAQGCRGGLTGAHRAGGSFPLARCSRGSARCSATHHHEDVARVIGDQAVVEEQRVASLTPTPSRREPRRAGRWCAWTMPG